MSRSLTASDRSSLIRLASSLPAGSAERKTVLAGLKKVSRKKKSASDFRSQVIAAANYIWGSDYDAVPKKGTLYVVLRGAYSLWKGGSNWKTLKELQTKGDDGDIRGFFTKVERIMVEMGPNADYYPTNKVGIVFVGDNGKVEAYTASLHEEKARLFPEKDPEMDKAAAFEEFLKEFRKGNSTQFRSKYWGVIVKASPIYEWREIPAWFTRPLKSVDVTIGYQIGFDYRALSAALVDRGEHPRKVVEDIIESAGDLEGFEFLFNQQLLRLTLDTSKGSPKDYYSWISRYVYEGRNCGQDPDSPEGPFFTLTNKALTFTGYGKGSIEEVTSKNLAKALAKLKVPKLGK